jgi:hypothetical protein
VDDEKEDDQNEQELPSIADAANELVAKEDRKQAERMSAASASESRRAQQQARADRVTRMRQEVFAIVQGLARETGDVLRKADCSPDHHILVTAWNRDKPKGLFRKTTPPPSTVSVWIVKSNVFQAARGERNHRGDRTFTIVDCATGVALDPDGLLLPFAAREIEVGPGNAYAKLKHNGPLPPDSRLYVSGPIEEKHVAERLDLDVDRPIREQDPVVRWHGLFAALVAAQTRLKRK